MQFAFLCCCSNECARFIPLEQSTCSSNRLAETGKINFDLYFSKYCSLKLSQINLSPIGPVLNETFSLSTQIIPGFSQNINAVVLICRKLVCLPEGDTCRCILGLGVNIQICTLIHGHLKRKV